MNITIQSEDLRALLNHIHCGGEFPRLPTLVRLYSALDQAEHGGEATSLYLIGIMNPGSHKWGDKIEVIKGVRKAFGFSLRGAKELVEAAIAGIAIDLGRPSEFAMQALRDSGAALTWELPETPKKSYEDFSIL